MRINEIVLGQFIIVLDEQEDNYKLAKFEVVGGDSKEVISVECRSKRKAKANFDRWVSETKALEKD